MDKVIVIRYGEIMLKGANKRFFEDKLVKQIRHALGDLGKPKVYKQHSRIYVDVEGYDENQLIERIRRVFGVTLISTSKRFDVDLDRIREEALKELRDRVKYDGAKTFKVETKRVDKNFPLGSLDLSRELGGHLLKNVDEVQVDVHNPDTMIYVEIREKAFVFSNKIMGLGGLPVGCNGKGLLLLSGGIDSPVAGWMVAKRGVEIAAVHFHSYPFTSERAKEKVMDLARIVSGYVGQFKVYSVNLLPIQKEINEKCPPEEMTILSRRFMMMIAERVASKIGANGLITGESLGQVASQTIESLHATNSAVSIPVFRPLIAMDKVDIIEIARKIDTYETSILPFEDCCTVFLPKRPVTKPRLDKILRSEAKLDVEALIEAAISNMEIERITLDEE
ncbi:tRNA uracil 4-sulfurtransferase ThiI [Alkaliphilus hydrothermalis]|uniref:Probable tRNA sulfurtransferase n=1 Tax=Alkaliphilus hydrothermalis TaxID=1482730 RepID=A0ABS2NPN8_9FIRM|nr:tRNA uracil 4-sulfurtransferase ThiI [Alkaliphilus hydrothermalis]MBM7614909.1 thiamine biosynthesis protein ThiI [Alkaliphilus hydrothermalis]